MPKDKYSILNLYKRVLIHLGPYKYYLILIFALGLLSTPLALLGPLPLKIIVDSVIGTQPLPEFLSYFSHDTSDKPDRYYFWIAIWLLIIVTILSQLLNLINWVLRDYVGERITLDTRALLFLRLQWLSLSYHDLRGINDSIYRISWDAPALRWLAIDGLLPTLTAFITVVAMLGVIALINVPIALIAICISPILILLNRLYLHRLRDQWNEVKKIESSILSIVQEALGAIRVVKAFGQEDREHRRFTDGSKPYIQQRVKVGLFESSFNFLVGSTTMIGTAMVIYFGTISVLADEITVGSLILVLSYVAQMYGPLETIGSHLAAQQSCIVSAERIFTILDEPKEVLEREGAAKITRAVGRVEFMNVNFSYKEAIPILNNITFTVPAGSRVGIVGKTGAGKTTLMSLLMRLYDPNGGAIYLDGKDVRDYKLADFRNQFSVVLQEPVLFATSIRDNIAYGVRTEVSDEEIVEAARYANAHDFVSRLPDGYDTVIGERGAGLSGGERQRIALARAFLKDAPILILDEPTSSVDVKTEVSIIEAMERLMLKRTTFMIAHRLSTLESCDLWLQLEHDQPVKIITSLQALWKTSDTSMSNINEQQKPSFRTPFQV